jgi:HAD superfamily hydrolase (TIGR01549 family)
MGAVGGALLIFDFDGVLADTRDDILRFAEIVCAELGHPRTATPEDLDALEPMSFDSLARQLGLPEHQVGSFTKRSFELFNARERPPEMVAGMSEVLARLSESCRLSIVTGNNSQTVRDFLDHHGLAGYFDVLLAADAPGSRAEKILHVVHRLGQPGDEVYMIGDAVSDILAARQASVRSVAASWGHQSQEKLEAARPDYVVRSPAQLLELFDARPSDQARQKV